MSYAGERLPTAPAARWRIWIGAGCAILVFVLVTAVTASLVSERRNALRSTVELTQRTAQLLRVVVDQMVRDVDGLADGLQMALAITPAMSPDGVVSDTIWAWLENRLVERPAVRSYLLLDSDGVVRRSNSIALIGRSLAKRPQFRAHRDGFTANGNRSVTDPFLSPQAGHGEIIVSWAVRSAVGDLIGVLSIGFDRDVVEERLGQLVDTTHDTVALIHGDRRIMAVAGVSDGTRIDSARWDEGLAPLPAAGRGVIQSMGLAGSQARWVVEVQPLAMLNGSIVLARDLDAALTSWRRHALAATLGTSLLLVAVLASALALTGLLERQGRALVAATTDALVDPLTSLFNRRMFDAVADIEVARARRLRGNLALVLIDIDHFKTVNDRHGHAAGDTVLVAVALHLKALIRREDVLVRIGGEEFALLLPQMPPAAALRQAERLRQAIEALDVEMEGAVLKVTISIGIAAVGHAGRAIETAFAAADSALYQAKSTGRNRVVLAEATATARMSGA